MAINYDAPPGILSLIGLFLTLGGARLLVKLALPIITGQAKRSLKALSAFIALSLLAIGIGFFLLAPPGNLQWLNSSTEPTLSPADTTATWLAPVSNAVAATLTAQAQIPQPTSTPHR